MHTADTVRILRVIAAVLAFTLFLWSTSFPGLLHKAQADDMTNVSDTLSDSSPNTASDHTIAFTLPNGMAPSQTITVTFPGTFTLPSLDFGENDLRLATATDEVLQDGAAGTHAWGVATTATTIVLTAPSTYGVGSSTALTLYIGDVASTGAQQITNPISTTTSYGIDIDTTWDSGQARVAIVDNVTISASVNTSLTFTVQGTTTGATINGSGTTTVTDTTAISIPYGVLVPGTSEVLGQDLFVSTNASNGFVVTVEATGPFDSSTSADIDWFDDGTYIDTPSVWSAPGNVLNQENTYGHWALGSSDPDFSATADRWISPSTSPQTVFQHDDVANGTVFGDGYANVGFQVEITSLQEAGTDYSTELIYIATPTF